MTVLVVRPAPACYELVETLNQSGIKALPAPLLSFSEGKDLPVLTNTYRRLPSGSVVVAVSPRAIEYTQQQFRNDNTAWRDDLHYVAVGEKTAQVWLEESGINALQPPTEDSEGMLSLSVFGEPEHLEVLILRGNGGRALLGNTLASRGPRCTTLKPIKDIGPVIPYYHWQCNGRRKMSIPWWSPAANNFRFCVRQSQRAISNGYENAIYWCLANGFTIKQLALVLIQSDV